MTETRHVDDLRLHPDAGIVPAMSEEEDDALTADIIERGVVTPLDVTEAGIVLDGRHRLRIARAVGLDVVPVHVVAPTDARDYMIRAALLRRHLTIHQRRELAATLLKQEPAKSDRQVASVVGLDHKTVATVRTASEASGEIPHVAVRQDSLGRQQPIERTQPEPRPRPEPDVFYIAPTPEIVRADRDAEFATVERDLFRAIRALDPAKWPDVSREDLERIQSRMGDVERFAAAWRSFTPSLTVVKGAVS